MHISASAEVYRLADPSLDKVRKLVIPYLNEKFQNLNLGELILEIRYIPIVMPDGMRERYPPRSNLRLDERLYDCAPQLDYEVFVSGSESMQVAEYLRGIESVISNMPLVGASISQIEDFRDILTNAARLCVPITR
jgi:hypothetical protein